MDRSTCDFLLTLHNNDEPSRNISEINGGFSQSNFANFSYPV